VDVSLSPAAQPDRIVDHRTYQMGLRTIRLRQETDQWGRSFEFIVNGVPVFAKGSNWIPADSFPTRISDEYLEGLILSAVASHQNMLRIWGGGLYEEERFYDLCDRYGILVWQEFIFACSVYPLDETAFVENVHVEAVQNIRRIRHRASLALWCGNNEMEWGWHSWGWSKPEFKDLKSGYDLFFHHTLPAWVAAEDPDTAYWPSSPSSDVPFQDPNGEAQGDSHYWDVWHQRKPFTAYRTSLPRFQSEFGFQALPPLSTIRTYAEPVDWNMTSYIMEHHQRSGSGNGLMIGQMTDTFRMPKDFPSLVYLSMLLQAEGIRYGVEHWRRNRARTAGTLYWQLNDCWPVASWSSLDFYGRWKALHYAARRFYAPVMLSILDDGLNMGIHVTSDLRETWQGTARWTLETLSGEALASGEETVKAAPLASTAVRTLDFSDRVQLDPPARLNSGNARGLVFVCQLWQGDRLLTTCVAPFVPSKHLALVDPGLAVTIRGEGDGLGLDITATSLARFVELSFEGADVVFSDNYFDVPAGRTISMTCPLPAGWTVEQARAALRVYSLYNSFA
jgi:beta-mannosidase